MKKTKIWTICYALRSMSTERDPWTASWYAYGRTKDEAAAAYLRGCEDPEDVVIINIVPGFSA